MRSTRHSLSVSYKFSNNNDFKAVISQVEPSNVRMLDLFAFGVRRCSDFFLLLTDVGVDINQSEARVKPIITCVHACSRA